MPKEKISFIFPAYNEEKGIAETLRQIPRENLECQGHTIEVIVVDNNSSDKTAEVAKEHGATVVVETKQGYGAAYKKGFAIATGDIFITADADGTYPLVNSADLLAVFEQSGVDFLTTNRFSRGVFGLKTMPLANRIGNFFLSFFFSLLFNFNLQDSQSGMWLFKRSIWDNAQIKSDSMAFSQELKIDAIYYQKATWLEYDISYGFRIGQKKLRNVQNGLDNLISLVRKRFFR